MNFIIAPNSTTALSLSAVVATCSLIRQHNIYQLVVCHFVLSMQFIQTNLIIVGLQFIYMIVKFMQKLQKLFFC